MLEILILTLVCFREKYLPVVSHSELLCEEPTFIVISATRHILGHFSDFFSAKQTLQKWCSRTGLSHHRQAVKQCEFTRRVLELVTKNRCAFY